MSSVLKEFHYHLGKTGQTKNSTLTAFKVTISLLLMLKQSFIIVIVLLIVLPTILWEYPKNIEANITVLILLRCTFNNFMRG